MRSNLCDGFKRDVPAVRLLVEIEAYTLLLRKVEREQERHGDGSLEARAPLVQFPLYRDHDFVLIL